MGRRAGAPARPGRRAELARATGKDFTYVYLSAGNPNYPNAPLEVQWKVYVADCDHVSGKSLNAVMQQAIAFASPEERAKTMRAEAARLLAEAAALAP